VDSSLRTGLSWEINPLATIDMEKVFTVLGWFVMASLAMAIARQLSEQKNLGPFSVYEAYTNPPQAEKKPVANYTLLADEFAPATAPGKLTAKTCYEADFQAATEKTGNYIQRTNNFKHGIPDSCSSQRTEMVNSFYLNNA
jgi:preprotein translocase subunit Sec63